MDISVWWLAFLLIRSCFNFSSCSPAVFCLFGGGEMADYG